MLRPAIQKMHYKVLKMEGFIKTTKRNLGLKYVKVFEATFPRPFKWIGGFIMPVFPFFVVRNKNWVSRLGPSSKSEVIIHELIHLKLLRSVKWIFLIFAIPLLASILLDFIGLNSLIRHLLVLSLFALILTYFEYETIGTTRIYAQHYNVHGIRQEHQTPGIYKRYFFIYIQMLLILSAIASLIIIFITKVF